MRGKKFIVGFLVVLSLFVFACSSQNNVNDLEGATNQDSLNDLSDDLDDFMSDFDVDYFYVEGGPMFEFFVDGEKNADIVVAVGDVIRIEFVSVGGMPHDFVIDELGVATAILQPGESEIIEFVADSVGVFEYYCSVGQHRERGMVGNIIVQ